MIWGLFPSNIENKDAENKELIVLFFETDF